jgi:hypothetical protein
VNLQLSYVPILIPTIRNTFLHLVCVMDVIKTGWMWIVLSQFYFEAPMWLVILIWRVMECVQDSNMLFVAPHINKLSSIPWKCGSVSNYTNQSKKVIPIVKVRIETQNNHKFTLKSSWPKFGVSTTIVLIYFATPCDLY